MLFNKVQCNYTQFDVETDTKSKIKQVLNLLFYMKKFSDKDDNTFKVNFNIPDLSKNQDRTKFMNKINNYVEKQREEKDKDLTLIKIKPKPISSKTPRYMSRTQSFMKRSLSTVKSFRGLSKNSTFYQNDNSYYNNIFEGVYLDKYPINRDINKPIKERLINVICPDFNKDAVRKITQKSIKKKLILSKYTISDNKSSYDDKNRTCLYINRDLYNKITPLNESKRPNTKTNSNVNLLNFNLSGKRTISIDSSNLHSKTSLINLNLQSNKASHDYNTNYVIKEENERENIKKIDIATIDSFYKSKPYTNSKIATKITKSEYTELAEYDSKPSLKNANKTFNLPNKKSSDIMMRKISQTKLKVNYEDFNKDFTNEYDRLANDITMSRLFKILPKDAQPKSSRKIKFKLNDQA